jgi:hypothetical protein
MSGQFKITTLPVTASTPVTITASYNGGAATTTLTVNPLVPVSVNLSQTSAIGGKTIYVSVSLNGVAPAGGALVSLSSSNPSAAPVPPSVTVAAGASTSPKVSFVTGSVSSTTLVTITATYQGYIATGTLTISP